MPGRSHAEQLPSPMKKRKHKVSPFTKRIRKAGARCFHPDGDAGRLYWTNDDGATVGHATYHVLMFYCPSGKGASTLGGGGVGTEFENHRHPVFSVPGRISREFTLSLRQLEFAAMAAECAELLGAEYLFAPWVEVYTERVPVGGGYSVGGQRQLTPPDPDQLGHYSSSTYVQYLACKNVTVLETPASAPESRIARVPFAWVKPAG